MNDNKKLMSAILFFCWFSTMHVVAMDAKRVTFAEELCQNLETATPPQVTEAFVLRSILKIKKVGLILRHPAPRRGFRPLEILDEYYSDPILEKRLNKFGILESKTIIKRLDLSHDAFDWTEFDKANKKRAATPFREPKSLDDLFY